MSQSFRRARKEMQHEKHKAHQHPTNVKQSDESSETKSLDSFLPVKPELRCTDCGLAVEEKNVRWITEDEEKKPCCRQCFLARMGKTFHDRD